MIRSPVVFAMALAACSQSDGNSSANSNAVEHAVNRCVPPALALADGSQLGSAMLSETKSNFAAAYESACAKDMFKARPLIERAAADQDQLFLINASEANVASIYLSDVDGNRMVLEYPFLTTDGRSQVPSADELEEAIYCAVRGATPQEQEASGRCLVD